MQQGQKPRVPAVEYLFTWPSDKPQLIGSKCKSCNTYYFPEVYTCVNPDCNQKQNVEQAYLSRIGKLWSYTIQAYQPPPPHPQVPREEFVPFAVGVVELPEGIRVIGKLTTAENLERGMKMELEAGKLHEDEDKEYLTWQFRPIEENKGG